MPLTPEQIEALEEHVGVELKWYATGERFVTASVSGAELNWYGDERDGEVHFMPDDQPPAPEMPDEVQQAMRVLLEWLAAI